MRRGAWKRWIETLRHREEVDEMGGETSLADQSMSAVALAIEAVRRLESPPQPPRAAASETDAQPPTKSKPSS